MGGMYQPLAPCPSCRRHVRAAEGSCPFCHAAIGDAQIVPSPTKRIARGAVFVFASTLAACGGSTEPEQPIGSKDTGTQTGDTSTTVDSNTPADTSLDTGNVAPPYGIPPTDTGVTDGTVDDTGGGMAKYGAPPPPADAG